MKTPQKFAAAALGITLTIATLGVGSAHAQAPQADPPSARLERACARVPNLELRTDNLLARINGDAATPGSLLWLDKQITTATEKNRTELVTVLTNRRAVRAASIDVLVQRQGQLAHLAEVCAAHGIAT